MGWFLCGWDEGLCSRSKAIMVGWYDCDNLKEKYKNLLADILTSSTQITILIN